MKYKFLLLSALVGLAAQCNKGGNPNGKTTDPPVTKNQADSWITTADQKMLLLQQSGIVTAFDTVNNSLPNVAVDAAKKYQAVEGFGYTLTGGSASLINSMEPAARQGLLNELFGSGENGISISYLRLSMGASDLDASVFSYNDLSTGETDIAQSKFSIAPDKTHLIPVLKSILAINPHIKIIATPWSPPAWMKDNNNSIGGSLKPAYYNSYATYFVKYIQAMKAEGIMITAVTPQNEPLHPGNNPSMSMSAEQQRDFIKNSLGPAFAAAGITAKIIVYDHNLDRPDYPATIYNDPEAAAYVDGAAFHLYAGDISAMGALHNSFPAKKLYFTEQWTGADGSFDGDLLWHIKNVIIGSMRNWSLNALEWNLANNPDFGPHTPGGCTKCKGALTISGSDYTRNVAYYIIAHASRFIPPGSYRIESNHAGAIQTVAFLRPDGKKVLIALNEDASGYRFNLKENGKWAPVSIPARSAMTIVW